MAGSHKPEHIPVFVTPEIKDEPTTQDISYPGITFEVSQKNLMPCFCVDSLTAEMVCLIMVYCISDHFRDGLFGIIHF